MRKRHVLTTMLAATACTPSQESVHVLLDVQLDPRELLPIVDDDGWVVQVTSVRVAVSDLQFSILGEMHGASASLGGWLISRAWAHPGHYSGGDVTGELVGDFILDWSAGMKLGTADLLTGEYQGMNFTFREAGTADGLTAADPLLGHTAHLTGWALKGEQQIDFTAVLDVAAGTQMVGAPFEDTVQASRVNPIVVRFLLTDPVDGTSLFAGLDFAALDTDGDGVVSIVPGDEAHNILRRTLQSHVHYNATPK